MDFAQILLQCRQNFGPAPRRFSWWSRKFSSSYRFALPAWLEPEDGLITLYQGLSSVMTQGFVTWAHIVQANTLLFDDGPVDSPGEVVYCTDRDNTVSPDVLRELAGSLAQLKNTAPSNPQLRAIADHLTDERTRAFALPVPVKGKSNVALSTTVFHRAHLPAAKITIPFFPVVVNTTGNGVVIPLPKAFWPRELSHWHQGASLESIAERPAGILYKTWFKSLLSWDAPIVLLVLLIPLLMSFFFPQRSAVMECIAVAVPVLGVLARLYHGRNQIKKNFCNDGTRILQLIALFVAAVIICLLDAMAILMRDMELSQGDFIVSLIMGAIYFVLAAFAMYPGKGWD